MDPPARFPLYRRQHLLPMSVAVVCALAAGPGAHADSSERDNVRKAMDTLLSQPPLLGTRASVEVVSLDDGAVIYARGANDALNPASNTKLVTAAAALLRLGPEFRFTTDFLVDKPLDAHGRVRTLYVRGRGDPTWNTERLYGLAADLWHRGVRQVGDIVFDDTYFDSEKWGPGWEQETSDKAYAAPVGALSLNHNAVAIYISAGTRAGQRARVELEPDADCFILQNKVTTIREDGHSKLRPHTYAEGERTRVVVEGRLPARSAWNPERLPSHPLALSRPSNPSTRSAPHCSDAGRRGCPRDLLDHHRGRRLLHPHAAAAPRP